MLESREAGLASERMVQFTFIDSILRVKVTEAGRFSDGRDDVDSWHCTHVTRSRAGNDERTRTLAPDWGKQSDKAGEELSSHTKSAVLVLFR